MVHLARFTVDFIRGRGNLQTTKLVSCSLQRLPVFFFVLNISLPTVLFHVLSTAKHFPDVDRYLACRRVHFASLNLYPKNLFPNPSWYDFTLSSKFFFCLCSDRYQWVEPCPPWSMYFVLYTTKSTIFLLNDCAYQRLKERVFTHSPFGSAFAFPSTTRYRHLWPT